ncbi:oxidoreductase [Aureivirga sp. CE67]|uniref:oxidoreductase n=1 Tax=Aureivirga sp. CE67 TaxID=1788983 RepID=UPI0018CA3EE8|nr:oxidoreductase [Aureivirga sp. CE67]
MKQLVVSLVICLLFNVQNILAQKTKDSKVILITGTASGMGKAFAEKLIKEGHIVYGGDIQYKKNEYLNSIGGHSLKMDVTKDDEVKAGVAKIIKDHGEIDVLINNAGYGLYGAVEEVTMEDAFAQFDVNLFGMARVTKAVLPHMRKQKSGEIINISSMGGKIYTGLGAWYHATKHAVEGWSDCLRVEVKQFGIDVVIVEPGMINTNFMNAMMKYIKKYQPNSNYQHMYKRMAEATPTTMTEPEVIAELINQIVATKNPETRYVKGFLAERLINFRKQHGDKAYDNLLLNGPQGQ